MRNLLPLLALVVGTSFASSVEAQIFRRPIFRPIQNQCLGGQCNQSFRTTETVSIEVRDEGGNTTTVTAPNHSQAIGHYDDRVTVHTDDNCGVWFNVSGPERCNNGLREGVTYPAFVGGEDVVLAPGKTGEILIGSEFSPTGTWEPLVPEGPLDVQATNYSNCAFVSGDSIATYVLNCNVYFTGCKSCDSCCDCDGDCCDKSFYFDAC